jgi:4-alpha-glucanotransferase
MREELADRRMPSYRLLWFDPGLPDAYPAQSLAAVTTHDLPTIAGIWTGREREMLLAAGLAPRDESLAAMRERLRRAAGLGDDAPAEEVAVRVHSALADAPSMLVSATLEDALGVVEPPNRPGTRHEWPNWSLALPLPLEAIQRSSLLAAIAGVFHARRADARAGFDEA